MEDKRCSICSSLEMEPFRIRHLKRPSFTRYSSYGHNKRRREKGGGHMVMEMKRSSEREERHRRTQQVKEGPCEQCVLMISL